jgi:hypothetical protein
LKRRKNQEEGIKQGDYTEKKQEQEQEQEHHHLSLPTQAYKLFSDRKTPLEVATELNLRETEAIKFYKEH